MHFGEIRSRFLHQYDQVKLLGLPEGYDFRKDGRLVEPNLMQRLVAYRLMTEKRVGNWSGVGAGKTISAVYSSGILKARLTVVVAANATVVTAENRPGDWERVVRSVFPDALVFTKKRSSEVRVEEGRPAFFITNYESFQQVWSEEFVSDLTGRCTIDLIVLDEVQSVRRRSEGGDPSFRREMVQSLIDLAVRKNPDLRILAMSATPVVNNLVEAKLLLEMLTGSEFPDLPTGSTVANAVRVHQLLVRHGTRYKPPYTHKIETSYPILDGVPSIPRLRGVEPGQVLQLEQATLETKLPHLPDWLGEKGRSRTMIYTHYVREIVDQVADAVRAAGYSVGLYTGSSKGGLEAFLREREPVDVLIGSAPLGTGVDGLQFVCNRLIFLSLPWSNAEYEQIIGRLWRQGSGFEKVEVIIPQVVLRRQEAGYWSWDDERARCIQYKKTLADAVLDGIIPEGHLPSREELQRRSLRALHEWIGRVSKGDPEIETGP